MYEGRRLATAVKGSTTASFTYNENGIRTSKTINGVKHEYILDGTKIVAEKWGVSGVTHYIEYIYDANSVIGMIYHNTTMAVSAFEYYFFEKNLQGDIVAVYNATGTKLVAYTYDAWGNVTTTYYNGGASTAAQYNGFRYRGYYYDSETGLYYLNSRYYDPATGRFINADGYISTGQGLAGFNMYSYCNNNPILYVDGTGNLPIVENDDTYYPEAFCEYLNAFGYKKLEQNVAAFNAETISEYLNGAGSGMSYAEYEAHKIANICTGYSGQQLGTEFGSMYDLFFSNFYSNVYSSGDYIGDLLGFGSISLNSTTSMSQAFGFTLTWVGVGLDLLNKYSSDFNAYRATPDKIGTAMMISTLSTVATCVISYSLGPVGGIFVGIAMSYVESGVKYVIIGY